MTDAGTLAGVLATSWIASRIAGLDAAARATVAALGTTGALDEVLIARALAALGPAGADVLREVTNALARAAPHALLAALVPGARFERGLDLRLALDPDDPRGEGDLVLTPLAGGGVAARVATAAGARALQALDRDTRSPIRELFTIGAASTDPAAARALAATDLPEVHHLYVPQMVGEHAAALILRCPALARYDGTMSPDVADAIATSSIRTLDLRAADDATLVRLARARQLVDLSLGVMTERAGLTAVGLAALAALPLRVLRADCCKLADDQLAAIASITSLEALSIVANRVGDAGGVALANLTRLRALDLHVNGFGDATLAAVATLPALELLDICDIHASADGIRALGASRSLRFVGIAWDCDGAITRAAQALPGLEIVESDMYESAGAIWSRGAFSITRFDVPYGPGGRDASRIY